MLNFILKIKNKIKKSIYWKTSDCFHLKFKVKLNLVL